MNKFIDGFFEYSGHILGVMLGLTIILSVMVYIVFPSPATFKVDSKHWECKAAQPVGIGAECIRLEKKL